MEYPICKMFKLFVCAVCQLEMKPGEGISLHAGSSQTGRVHPWDGPFLCRTCQAKMEAMEGKRPSRGMALTRLLPDLDIIKTFIHFLPTFQILHLATIGSE